MSSAESNLQDNLTFLSAELVQANIHKALLTASSQRIVPATHLVVTGFGLFLGPIDPAYCCIAIGHFLQCSLAAASPRRFVRGRGLA